MIWDAHSLFDAVMRRVITLPRLHEPKEMPISLFIPCPDDADAHDLDAAALSSKQFEAFVYRNPHRMHFIKSWISQLLPPPPYVYDIAYLERCPEIRSYPVLGDGFTICISVHGVGTYCLNTRSFTWSRLVKWMLPFHGKVEYVPALKLWVGLSSANAQDMAVADLSSTDS
uniref:Uncharacterized protein n=1 Tax=Oryza punctata TaxID=4537 RepID=A0A0E0JSE0_ORYPU